MLKFLFCLFEFVGESVNMFVIVYNLEVMYCWRYGKFVVFFRVNWKGKLVVLILDFRVFFENWDFFFDKIFSFVGEEYIKFVNVVISGDFFFKYLSVVLFKLNNFFFLIFFSFV